ncbi:hypothetical protein K470DRAFT_252206 [Piedraia hortae CBS 480.64]|uniref:BRCT domain-containing protein n=1 Tax=Piedraia hortae CBS 480.64 TaxID=1314780 RepID=A0A6A7BU06_9PEZI|nr:hypothetical protein K470DRAFT_252206 [Piedraia hortae CBS 480.64]
MAGDMAGECSLETNLPCANTPSSPTEAGLSGVETCGAKVCGIKSDSDATRRDARQEKVKKLIAWDISRQPGTRETMAAENEATLFKEVVFAIAPGDEEGGLAKAADLLESHGARRVSLAEDEQKASLDSLTHILSTNIDFPQYRETIDRGIQTVKPSWVHQCITRHKLVGTRQHSPDPSQYLQDIVVCFAGLPEADEDAIHAGVVALGGSYNAPLTRQVTHLVATDYNHEKCKGASAKLPSCKIVLPHWFDDCFKLGKKISEDPYLLPDPPYLRTSNLKPVPGDFPQLAGATAAQPRSSDAPSPSWARKGFTALKGRTIKLSSDLSLSPHLKETLSELLEHGGATVTEDLDEADLYIGRYRDAVDYVKASRDKKEVANLAWLYNVINNNRYTNPASKLLHYPVPRSGIPGFEKLRISVSNYVGDSRTYLENLITSLGAQFTRSMKQDNTHLVTAHTQSEKCEAAQEWNMNIVNHLWLEESYAKCALQSLTNPKYTTFPANTNLGEICGQVPLDMDRIEEVYFPKPKPVRTQVSPVKIKKPVAKESSPTKEVTSSRALEAIPVREKVPARENSPVKEKVPAKKKKVAAAAAPSDSDTAEDDPKQQPSKTPRSKAVSTPRQAETSASPIPLSSGRASKLHALNVMHKQAEDIALFQKEMKRKGGVLHGGRRQSIEESPGPATKKKRARSEGTSREGTADGIEGENKGKKAAKKAKIEPPVQQKLMVTGDDRWVDKPKEEEAAKSRLRMLGVQLTQDPRDVDVLVAPKILRTRKFVAALACAPLVVETSYLDNALERNQLTKNPPLLVDVASEQRLGFKLSEALQRAKANQRRLFRGWTIYVTEKVPGGFETYKEIITLNGGEAQLYQGKAGTTLSIRWTEADGDAPERENQEQEAGDEDRVYLVSGTSAPEKKICATFRATAEKQGLEARVVRNDWILNAAMSQRIIFDKKWGID